MKNSRPKSRPPLLTPALRARLAKQRQMIAQELPELAAGDRMRKEASAEPTFSGELRRAIHASPEPLAAIAAEARISPVALDEFLTGERTLRSDVLDRLTAYLGLALSRRE